jgi:alpha-tubulin suppressor-like RCC1 family protein
MTDENGSGGSLVVTCYVDADGDAYGTGTSSSQCRDGSAARMSFGYCPTGYTATAGDCLDSNPSVRPGAVETCNGLDDNCSGAPDEGVTTNFYRDADGDGYGAGSATAACTAPSGFVANNTDCNDTCATCRPGGTEVCDSLDNNCNGTTDEGTTVACYTDADNDTYAPMGASAASRCPDTSRPLFGNCPSGLTSRQPATAATSDCADTTASRNPGVTEACNGIDDDCDGVIDDGVTVQCYVDTDNDSYAASGATASALCPDSSRGNVGGCPVGYTNRAPAAGAIDCAPTNAMVNPSAVESCNGVDDNCSGVIDEGAGIRFYQDADHDGFGNPAVSQVACAAPANYVADSTDCGDTNPLVHPGATEICNGIDDNCVGGVDEAGAAASCGSVPNTTFACAGGACVPSCASGFANCDGVATNGCEVNLNTDGQHCGSCARSCGVGSTCTGGTTCDQPSMVAAGAQYTCVLRSSGRLVCFGDNSQGQFGTGDTVSSTTPVWVPDISGATRVAAAGDQNFAVFGQHTCVTAGGSLLCTGRNNHAQLGNGTFATPSLRFTGASTCGSSVCGTSGNVSLGASHSCARNGSGAAGDIFCWGYGGDGEIGDGGFADRPYPVSIFSSGGTDVAAGPAATCAVISGGVRCWGSNLSGLSGDGSSTSGSYTSPNPVCNSSGASCTLLSSIAGVEVGYSHACAYETAVAGGDVWCWGGNADLQRGDASSSTARPYAAIVPGTSGTSDLVLGTFHTCALRSGGVWCWGVGSARGDGGSTNTATPVQVRISATTLLTGVTQISAGAAHTCALTSGGDVYCWGDNSNGQLGIGNTTNQIYATRIASLRQ